jgi:hypothetical protein
MTERWLRRQVAEKKIAYVKMRRLVMFRPDDLDAVIAQNLVHPVTGEPFAVPPRQAPMTRRRQSAKGRR